jgi:hypothetical protein
MIFRRELSMRIVPHAASLLLFLIALTPSAGFAQEDAALPDYTNVNLQDLGIAPVEAKDDPTTGFGIGGKNPTATIEKLTEINGRTIAALEKKMRPGMSSQAGFLGPDERLLDVMAADNRYVVEDRGLTHQELARHLHAMGAIALRDRKSGTDTEFRYHGRRYRVQVTLWRGFQPSPFGDGTKAHVDAVVENLDNGTSIEYSLLVPHMIERYGFYEGHGTPYRVEPRQVLEVFDFLQRR